jgi:hypothetical protein
LNYLIWFYAATIALAVLLPRVAPQWCGAVQRGFRTVAEHPLRAFFLAVPSIVTLWFMRPALWIRHWELIPEQRTLVAYAFFYLCGWLLYGEADLLERFPRFAWTHVVLGLAQVPVTLAALLQAGQPFVVRNTPQHLTAIVSGASRYGC